MRPLYGGEVTWSSGQLEIRRWLHEHAVPLEGLYEAAVHIVATPAFPGRIHLAGHCVREIANRLPDYYPGVDLPKRKRVEYVNELDEIARQWQRSGLPTDGTVPAPTAAAAGEGAATASGLELPVKLIGRLSRLVGHHLASRVRKDAAARALYAASVQMGSPGEEIAPQVTQWMDVTTDFLAWTHARKDGKVPDASALEERFAVFERALLTLMGSVGETLDELDEILEDTNS